ncbi:armadillo-type protein [Mucidula mucida]|nr:armadillo-type protein [Mucidula mucida]
MDLSTLAALFGATLSPDANVRTAAEREVRTISAQPGLITALLDIVRTEGVDSATRQSCVVFIKNRVFTHYAPLEPDDSALSEQDKEALRGSLVGLIASGLDRPLRLQLQSTLKSVLANDFPGAYPAFLPTITALLGASNTRDVRAGLVGILEAVRAFRYVADQKVLVGVIEATFPTLVRIGDSVLEGARAGRTEDQAELVHILLKTYKTSTALGLSDHQRSAESLVPWGRLLFGVVGLDLAWIDLNSGVAPDQREESEWWAAKKWAYAILGRLFHRYGNPSQLPGALKKEYGSFASHFVDAFAPEILSTYLAQVDRLVQGEGWMSEKCQYHVFTFFNECIKPASTWALLKPHVASLVSAFVFPLLSFTPERQQLWESDPVDYVRVGVDDYTGGDGWQSAVSAATTFLISLVSNRTKACFEDVVGYLMGVLQDPTVVQNPSRRFGALNAIAALGPWIMRHPKLAPDGDASGKLEEFVMSHVVPALAAPEGWVRAIACEVLGTLVKHGLVLANGNLEACFERMWVLMEDADWAVRCNCVLAVGEGVKMFDTVRTALQPRLGRLVTSLLALSAESDLDVLNASLEHLVDTYGDALLPFSVELCGKLCEGYARLVNEVVGSVAEVDADDDKTFAAMGVAKTLWTVVSSVEGAPQVLTEIAGVVTPVVLLTLEGRCLDLFDSMYDLVDSLSFKLRSVPLPMWRIFELTWEAFCGDTTGAGGYAVDYLEEMLPSLDNFVSFGSAHILSPSAVFSQQNSYTYKQALIDMYVTAQTNKHLGENDRVCGCKLIESVLLNLRGGVDEYIPIILTTTLHTLSAAETPALKLGALLGVVNCLLYNPALALNVLGDGSGEVLGVWGRSIEATYTGKEPLLRRVHDKRLSILAICALLELDAANVPPALRGDWPKLIEMGVKLFKDYAEAVKARKSLEATLETEEDVEDDEDELEGMLNDDEDGQDVWDADSAYLEMLAQEGARLRGASAKDLEAEEEDDEDDSDDEIEEELGFFTPLDGVDVYVVFRDAVGVFQSKNPGAMPQLPMELQTVMMEVGRKAEGGV